YDFLHSLLYGVVRRKADQPLGPVDLHHYVVTGVDTCGTVHAFELRAVADVDTCGAYVNTQFAVDTISTCSWFVLAELRPGLSANPVVSHHDRLPGQQYPLQSAVRAYRDTGLLAKARKHAVEDSRKGDKHGETCEVVQR